MQRRLHLRILREWRPRPLGAIRLCEVRRSGGVARRRPLPLAVGEAADRAHHRLAQVAD